jgi:hypothetical protein
VGIIVLVAVIQLDDVITATMGIILVNRVAHVDDGHRRAWSLRHQLTRAVTIMREFVLLVVLAKHAARGALSAYSSEAE